MQYNGLEPYREAERWQSEEMTLNVKKRPTGTKATINLSVYIEGETLVRCDIITDNHISEKRRYLTFSLQVNSYVHDDFNGLFFFFHPLGYNALMVAISIQ